MQDNIITKQTLLGAVLFGAIAVFTGTLGMQAAPGPKSPSGRQIFQKQCASCHGAKGEGTKQYQKALTGSRSVGELGKFIAQSMPPGPKKCKAADAKLIAAYIYDAFYSPLAQARNKPARVSLSRLTVRQFRNAVTDLVGSFRDAPQANTQRGLNAEYFKAKRFQQNERVIQRVDPEVHFDFGTAGPVPDQFEPHQFSIRWQGSVLAPDTGEYEFIVRTEHATRLWVNDMKKELIDRWVKSGTDTEFHGTVFLLGGRTYPLRLEFSKSTQGVDDTDKLKGKPSPKASISLEWRQPKQAVEVIPSRCLLPTTSPETFVPATPFPPDDRSIGYERGNSVSKAWDEATTAAALETASYVNAHLRELSGAENNAPDRPAKLRAFCSQFVERAFRRPLTDETEKFYIARQFEGGRAPEAAVKRVVLLTLLSPRFLYREINSAEDSYDVASRLSFGLWDSLPDQELLKAAAAGQLLSREQVVKQAERMAADPRAWTKLRDFLMQWLKVDQSPDLGKDAKLFPGFDPVVASDLRTSLELFLENTVWNDKSDYRELMLSDKTYLNGRLAKLYGAKLAPDAPFQPVSLDGSERAGVITQPYILACFAHSDTSSPIHRGVLITRSLLGRTLLPPPAAFTPLPADQHPNLTTRQRIDLQTKPAACTGCHGMINPLGYTLEKYDAIGRLRDRENGQTIDTSGSYKSRAGQTVKFAGAKDLSRYLAGSDDAHAAFVEKLFQHLVKQPILAYGPATLPNLERSFEENQFSIRKLMVEIMAASALTRYNNNSLANKSGDNPHDISQHAARISPRPGS